MQTHVVTVQRAASLLDVQRLLVEEEIHGAPVVDEEGELLGVISSTDVLRAADEEHNSARVRTNYFRDVLPYSSPHSPDWSQQPVDLQDALSQIRAEDVMTRSVLAVPPDAPAAQVARVLREHRVHRVFVVERGRLCGVVSTLDLLRVIEEMLPAQ
jgi:CBS domain-containing protein